MCFVLKDLGQEISFNIFTHPAAYFISMLTPPMCILLTTMKTKQKATQVT